MLNLQLDLHKPTNLEVNVIAYISSIHPKSILHREEITRCFKKIYFKLKYIYSNDYKLILYIYIYIYIYISMIFFSLIYNNIDIYTYKYIIVENWA